MAKPAICYAVVRGVWNFQDRTVLAVTTRKPNGRVWGRDLNRSDKSTNRAARDVLGLYDTQENAVNALARIDRVRSEYAPRITEAQGWVDDLERQRDDAVDEALQGPGRLT